MKSFWVENGDTFLSAGTLEERVAAFNRSGRTLVQVPVALRLDSEGKQVQHPALTVDLSSKGARVHTSIGLVPGQVVTIITEDVNRRSIPGRVVWVGPVGSRLEGHAGIQFLRPVPAWS